MKAIVLAGGSIAEDSLLRDSINTEKKSLAPICGKPMVQWVMDALNTSAAVDDIWISGLTETDGIGLEKSVVYVADQGGIFENIRYCANQIYKQTGKPELVFIVSADIPGLQAHMVDWLAAQIEDDRFNLYYSTASQTVIERTFPGANRSYIRLKDIAICGGDINIINTDLFQNEKNLWKELTLTRKSPLKQAGMIGIGTLILVLLRAITLEKAVNRICHKLEVRGKALHVPYAEMAMDVDKPHQFQLMETYLDQRNHACV